MLTKFYHIPKLWVAIIAYLHFVLISVLIADRVNFFSVDVMGVPIICLTAFSVLFVLKKNIREDWFALVNFIVCYALLIFLYGQTSYTSSLLFGWMDAHLIWADEQLFGFQPSLAFSKTFSQCFLNELFHFGYFSYYLMPLIILYFLFRRKKEKIDEFGFVLITSFLVYYILFVFFPAVGPLFYYSCPMNYVETCGIFGKSIRLIQQAGEVPAGAFPSSHVGVSVILLIWVFKYYRSLFFYFLPVVVILIFSTVYIKAHYAVDTIAGLLTAPVIYFLVKFFYKSLSHFKN